MESKTENNKSKTIGSLYFLWAERTQSFKIGFTRGPLWKRAYDIEASSPVPIRVLAGKSGTMRDEKELHQSLRRYRSHREWYVLPEDMVWQILQWFGVEIPVDVP